MEDSCLKIRRLSIDLGSTCISRHLTQKNTRSEASFRHTQLQKQTVLDIDHSGFVFHQVPLVLPFGQVEFKCRVEAVKSAVMTEMTTELAQDMRSYNLACRRLAVCKDMITPQIEKAARTLGILGFWPNNTWM